MSFSPSSFHSWSIRRYGCVSSTMDVAAALIPHLNLGEKIAITADIQTRGRGRRDRPWQSHLGNLHASLIMGMGGELKAPQWGFAASYALLKACITLGISPNFLRLKWPNDLLLGGGKLAGFLMMAEENGPFPTLVIGVGVNIGEKPSGLPYPAACLGDYLKVLPSSQTVLFHFLTALDGTCHMAKRGGFDAIRRAWLSHAQGVGQPITLTHGEKEGMIHGGIFDGIDDDGALLMTGMNGKQNRFWAGDVSMHGV